MKVTLLLLEDLEKDIQEEVRKQSEKMNNTSDYDRVLAELEGKQSEQESIIYVDITKYYKLTDFFFKKESVVGLFMSTKTTKLDNKIMVIIIDGQEYDCLFDVTIYEELKQFLNN